MRIINLTPAITNYINPTIELIDRGIQGLDEVFSIDAESLSNGETVANLVRKHGNFDLIVLKGGLFFKHGLGGERAGPPDLFDCGLPILVIQMGDDLHGWRPEHGYAFDRLRDSGAFILSSAASAQFFKPFTEDTFQREAWLARDCYVAQHPEVIANNERYLMFPHPIGESEFLPIDWEKKKYDVSVMGVRYALRRKVIEHLEQTKKFKYKTKKDFIQQIASRLFVRSRVAAKIYKSRFIDIIRKSVASITCDGSVGYPVRKFFEIPAFGAVLMAEFFHDAKSLGFIDRENCFYLNIDHFNEMDETIESLITDSAWARQIAEAGQEMVRENHSVKVRLQNFLSIAEAIAAGTLKTTRWEAGKLKLISND